MSAVVARGPAMLLCRVPVPDELPDTHDDMGLNAMLRSLTFPPLDLNLIARSALASIPVDELRAVLNSLANTICRATYHRRRFERVVQFCAARRAGLGPVGYDATAHFAVYEAAGVLGASRSAVDEIMFVSARRAGESASGASRWEASPAIFASVPRDPRATQRAAAYSQSDEVLSLRAERDWFAEMNAYRVAFTHHGWNPSIGAFYPAASPLPEASDPRYNVMLIPDPASLEGPTTRGRRSNAWTYVQQLRLEDLVVRVHDGLERVVQDIALRVWRMPVPPDGTEPRDRRPNVILHLPRPAFVLVDDRAVWPVFATERDASGFHARVMGSDERIEVREIGLTTEVHDGVADGNWLWIPDAAAFAAVGAVDRVEIVRGAVVDDHGPPRFGEELCRLSVSGLAGEGGAHVKIRSAGPIFVLCERAARSP